MLFYHCIYSMLFHEVNVFGMSSRGVMAQVLDGALEVSVFELQLQL